MYLFLRIIDKILYRIKTYRILINGLFLSGASFANRDAHDRFIMDKIEVINDFKKELPSVSAVYRVKNGETFIESAILSIVPLVTEIVFVDNGSTDHTLNIVDRLKQKLNNNPIIRIIHYPYDVALAGNDYQESIQNQEKKTLAQFYNFAFSQAKSDYLIKADAHYLFSLEGLEQIQKRIANASDIIYYRGSEIYGKNLSVEPHCFKRSIDWTYVDEKRFEILRFKGQGITRSFILKPVFLHVKRIAYSPFINTPVKGKKGLYMNQKKMIL